MPVIATNQWLKNYLKHRLGFSELDMNIQRDALCANLTSHFSGGTTVNDIHHHLLQNGMFLPSLSDQPMIDTICVKNFWEIVEEELEQLKIEWDGPDIPIFIFPSNTKNEQIRIDFNGRSGLSHHDKIFLFVSTQTTNKELQALFTHEYNHVCRLNYLNQAEESINLLDGMVLEGLAEEAVHNRFGKDSLAKWTSLYPIEYVLEQWKKEFQANLHLKKSNTLHNAFMYGSGRVPKWMGYTIGFHLVSSFAKNTGYDMKEMLHLPSETILGNSFA